MNHCLQCEREVPDAMLFCEQCSQHRIDPLAVPGFSAEARPPATTAATVTAAAAERQSPPARASVSGRELLMIAVAFVVAGVGTYEFLSASSRQPARAPAPVAATAAAEPAGPVRPADGPRKWNASNRRWIGDERHAAAFELLSNNEVHLWQRRDARPILVVRCISKRSEAFVFIESAAQIEPQDEKHGVRIRFDDGPELSERWPDSDDHDALFAPDGAGLVGQLLAARTLRFGYTPHNAPPAVAEFNVTGLREVFELRSSQCAPPR